MPPKSKKTITTEVVVRAVTPASARRPVPRQRSRPSSRTSVRFPNPLACPIVQALVNCIRDPFSYAPVRLGLGTMQPTQLYTTYVRGTLIMNADGSMGLALLPSLRITSYGPLLWNIAGAGSTTWGGGNFDNDSTVNGLMGLIRCVAIGLRARPLLAMTAAPGVVYSGALPPASFNEIAALTPTAASNLPQLVPHPANFGSSFVAGMPMDLSSFMFITPTQGATTILAHSVPMIVFKGWPASTPVYFEGVAHFESIQTAGVGSLVQDYENVAATSTTRDSILSYVPSLESLMNTVRSAVATPGGRRVLSAAARHMAVRAGFTHNLFNGDRGPDRLMIEDVD